jgi:class 3 adenylate cyclase
VLASEAARQRGDPRLFLVSMALLVSAGFLALHALATPGVVLADKNAGFVIATPVGLLLASAFAAGSALDLDERGIARLRRWQSPIRATVAAVLILWALASLTGLSPLDRAPAAERLPLVLFLLPFGVGAYLFAAVRYFRLARRRRRVLPFAIAIAFVLLAEALVAVAFGRAWHVSWWEWHVLMAVAFGAVLLATRHEYRTERSVAEAFGGVYLERTLERFEGRQRDALEELTAAIEHGDGLDEVGDRLRAEGFTGEEVAALGQAARELSRVDGLLRRYVGPRLAEELHRQPGFADLGGQEQEISALFADLAGFTSFSEDRDAADVVDMLNTYWQAVVPPIVDEQGGVIERFAGDAILVVFNALGDQPDHVLRAARSAVAVQEEAETLRSGHDGWPRFRVGVNTGVAVVGSVGGEQHRSFAAIGDTTNVASRLQSIAAPGQIVIGPVTADRLGDHGVAEPIGAVDLKGKAEPVDAFRLISVD